ncbi:hypothetical protein CCH79_00008098 [Gambusia affinis]|uniref:Uncharacterized protein n=1 Tax=Gambusia affinis TaxID=33528 RepID=A0A315V2V0_GAMAF|nr:hypothetical protein CCH79_00008098 [Gambusia affinis]
MTKETTAGSSKCHSVRHRFPELDPTRCPPSAPICGPVVVSWLRPSLHRLLIGCASRVLRLHDVRKLRRSGERLDAQRLKRIIWERKRRRKGVFCGLQCPLNNSRLTGKGGRHAANVVGSGSRTRDGRVEDSRPSNMGCAIHYATTACPTSPHQFNNTHTHSVDYVMRQPGEDSQRIPKVCDDVGNVLRHRGWEAGLHGDGLHPPGVEVLLHHDGKPRLIEGFHDNRTHSFVVGKEVKDSKEEEEAEAYPKGDYLTAIFGRDIRHVVPARLMNSNCGCSYSRLLVSNTNTFEGSLSGQSPRQRTGESLRLETIFEVPLNRKNGSESWFGPRRVKRFLEFLEVGEARKPKKPLVGVGKTGPSSSRPRRGGFPKDEPSLGVQDVDSLLCSKLDELNLWLIHDQSDERETDNAAPVSAIMTRCGKKRKEKRTKMRALFYPVHIPEAAAEVCRYLQRLKRFYVPDWFGQTHGCQPSVFELLTGGAGVFAVILLFALPPSRRLVRRRILTLKSPESISEQQIRGPGRCTSKTTSYSNVETRKLPHLGSKDAAELDPKVKPGECQAGEQEEEGGGEGTRLEVPALAEVALQSDFLDRKARGLERKQEARAVRELQGECRSSGRIHLLPKTERGDLPLPLHLHAAHRVPARPPQRPLCVGGQAAMMMVRSMRPVLRRMRRGNPGRVVVMEDENVWA